MTSHLNKNEKISMKTLKLDVGLNTSLIQLICRQEPKHLNFSAQKEK
jgi:hypothetical protein